MSGVTVKQPPGEGAVLRDRRSSPPERRATRRASSRAAPRPARRDRSRSGVSWLQCSVWVPSAFGVSPTSAPLETAVNPRGTVAIELPRHLVVGKVVGRKPEVVVVVLALAPDLPRAMRAAVGLDEREAASVLDPAVVVDREPQRVTEGGGPREVARRAYRRADRQRSARPTPCDRADAAGRAPASSTIESIRARRATSVVATRPVERRRVPVEIAHADALVHEIVVVRARVGVVGHALEIGIPGLLRERRRGPEGNGKDDVPSTHRASSIEGTRGIYSSRPHKRLVLSIQLSPPVTTAAPMNTA